MYVVNIDRPTRIARIHEWPNGNPKYEHCMEQPKNRADGEWTPFESEDEAQQFARESGLRIKLCQSCQPSLLVTESGTVIG